MGGRDDVAVDDPEALIELSHQAWAVFVTGDPRPALALFSHRDDVTISNPFVPYSRGWDDASATIATAARNWRDGEVIGFERVATYASTDLVSILEIERYRARVGAGEDLSPVSLRVTTTIRREDEGWRIASRHADPITSTRPAESVLMSAEH